MPHSFSRYDFLVEPPDYETPKQSEPRPTVFWFSFATAYFFGILLLNGLDDFLHRRATGHPNDGGVMVLSIFAAPVFAGVAALLRGVWKRYESASFAVIFAIFAPLVVYLIRITFSL